MKVYFQNSWFQLKEQKNDWKMFFWFFLYLLIPGVWILFRTYIITGYLEADLNTYSYWEYLNIVLEIVQETLIFPLFWFVGQVKVKQEADLNKAKQIYLFCGVVYSLAIIIISFFVKNLLNLLAASNVEGEIAFFELQLFSKIFIFLTLISTVYLLNLKLYQAFGFLLILNLLLTIGFDFTFANQQVFNNQYLGLGLSTFLSQFLIFICGFLIVAFQFGFKKFFSLKKFWRQKLKFNHAFWSNLIASMLFSSINNGFYLFMIARNLNFVNNSDAYWLSNTMIWSWTLIIFNVLRNIQKSLLSTTNDLNYEKIKFNLIEFQILSIISFEISLLIFYQSYHSLTMLISQKNSNLVNRSFAIFKKIVWFYFFYVSTQSLMTYFNVLGKNWTLTFHSFLVNLIVNIPFIILIAQYQVAVTVELIIWIFSITQIVAWLLIFVFVSFELKQIKIEKGHLAIKDNANLT